MGAFFALSLQTDSPSFANAILLWAGDETAAPDRLMRLSKPFSLLLPLFLYKMGLAAYVALLVQQHLAFALSLFFLYKIGLKLSNSVHLAQLFTVLYAGSGAVGVYGLAILVDMSAWAAMLGLILLILNFYDNNKFTYNKLFLLGICLALGFFVKENVAVAGIFLFLLIILNPYFAAKVKFCQLITAGAGFLPVLIGGLFFTRFYFGYNLIDWIIFNKNNAVTYQSPFLAFCTQTFRSLDLGWFLVFWGIFAYFFINKTQKKRFDSSEKAFILTGVLGLGLFPLIWGYYMDRILFMFAPCWLYLAAFGLQFLYKKGYFLAFVAAFLNILANLVVYNFPIAHFLPLVYGFYAILLIIMIKIKS